MSNWNPNGNAPPPGGFGAPPPGDPPAGGYGAPPPGGYGAPPPGGFGPPPGFAPPYYPPAPLRTQGNMALGFVAGFLGGCIGYFLVLAFAKGPDTKKGAGLGLVCQLVLGGVMRAVRVTH
jgi:hypothetical protein